MRLVFNLRTVVKIVLVLVGILILHTITANGESTHLQDSGGVYAKAESNCYETSK